MNMRYQSGPIMLILFFWGLGFWMSSPVMGFVKPMVRPTLPGYHEGIHQRVLMEIYIDFYCPHCHDFVTTVLPAPKNEFESYVEIKFIGLLVVESSSTLPFEIYEAACLEGKGEEMVHLLFETLQIKHQSVQPSKTREAFYQQLGLVSERMTGHLESGRALQNLQKEVQ